MEILAGIDWELIVIMILQIDYLIARTVLGRPHVERVLCVRRILTKVRTPILPPIKSVSNTPVIFTSLDAKNQTTYLHEAGTDKQTDLLGV